MHTSGNRKQTHSRYNKERWNSRHKKNRKLFIQGEKKEKYDTSGAAQIQISHEDIIDKQVLKSSFLNQKNHIESTQDKLRQAKKELKQEKKELRDKKKNLKKAEHLEKKKNKKHKGILTSVLVGVLFVFGILLTASALWLYRTFPRLKMDELIYEATSPLQGTGGGMVEGYIKQAAVPAMIALVVVIVILIVITKKGKKARRIGKSVLCGSSALCIGISGVSFWNRLDLGDYLKNQNSTDDFIASEYVDPAETQVTFPQKKRNLIYIYLESMEMTYADPVNGGAFSQNVIPELTKLSEENENFSGGHNRLDGAHSLPGTTWTMGGMFAATSGLPLQISIGGNNMDTQTSFFPGITTIGDILENNGYQNVFACGSDASFGGRALYYQTHGNYEIHDIKYAEENGWIPKGYRVWWGFEDEKLIAGAKKDLEKLGNGSQPFNYTMLTVDTHFPDGYVCDLCKNDFPGNQYANVMACSSRQITQLIAWIQQQPWYDNTTIVLSGDHPTMSQDFCKDIDPDYQRRVYTAYINAKPEENRTAGYRDFSTFDNFPTTLAALGCDIEGNRLGLGTNLYSGEKTMTERLGLEQASSDVSKKSEFMVKKSEVNQNSKELLAREGVSPTATVRLESYNPKNGKAKISVSDIFYTAQAVNSISADVVQADGYVNSVKLKRNTHGIYEGMIDVPDRNPENINLSITAHEKNGKKKKEKTEKLFAYQGNLYMISLGQSDFAGTLEGLSRLDRTRYTFFIATQGNSQKYLNADEKKQLEKLGVSVPKENTAYAAVITSDGILQKEASGTFTFNDMLEDNTPFEISAADESTQMNSSIHIGNDFREYSPGSNGYDIVVWDTVSRSVALQYSFDTSSIGPEADVKATMDPKKEELTVKISNVDGIPGWNNVMALVGNDTDHCAEKNITLNTNEDKTVYTGTISLKDADMKHLYVRVYGEGSGYKWWNIGDYKVSEKSDR